MRFSESEIVEDVLEHIRQAGGEFSEWHVGTAAEDSRQKAVGSGQQEPKDQHAPGRLSSGVTGRPLLPGAPAENSEQALICREAYTTYAAEEVVDRLKSLGLRRDRPAVPQPGKTVFVYRRPSAHVESQEPTAVLRSTA